MSNNAEEVNAEFMAKSKEWAKTDKVERSKRNAVSVYLDDELALALNRLRETVRQHNEAAGLPPMAPSLSWLARSLLRDKLGLVDSKAAKHDAPGSV
ncbi:MAG TPA: hypothetical protein VGI71_23630 [Scandinavium sp.]